MDVTVPFCKWRNWGFHLVRNSPIVTKLVRGRAGIHTHEYLPLTLHALLLPRSLQPGGSSVYLWIRRAFVPHPTLAPHHILHSAYFLLTRHLLRYFASLSTLLTTPIYTHKCCRVNLTATRNGKTACCSERAPGSRLISWLFQGAATRGIQCRRVDWAVCPWRLF